MYFFRSSHGDVVKHHPDGVLSTTGASWSMGRWAADHVNFFTDVDFSKWDDVHRRFFCDILRIESIRKCSDGEIEQHL